MLKSFDVGIRCNANISLSKCVYFCVGGDCDLSDSRFHCMISDLSKK